MTSLEAPQSRCVLTITQMLENGQVRTNIEGHIEPEGRLTAVAVLMILHDAWALILGKMAQVEMMAPKDDGQDKKAGKPDLWVPDRFRGVN